MNHYFPLFVFLSILSSFSVFLLKYFPKVNKSFPLLKNLIPFLIQNLFFFPSLSLTFSPDSFHFPLFNFLLYFPSLFPFPSSLFPLPFFSFHFPFSLLFFPYLFPFFLFLFSLFSFSLHFHLFLKTLPKCFEIIPCNKSKTETLILIVTNIFFL